MVGQLSTRDFGLDRDLFGDRGWSNSTGSSPDVQSDLAGAGEKIREAISLRNELGEKSGVAEVNLLLANLAIEEGHASAAEVSAREASATFRAARMPELEIQARATPVIQETEKMRALSDLFEARFVRADLELKYGNQVAGGTLVAGIEKDGGASGFALIARKAAQAAGQSKIG
jgi:hypothetical protein